MSKIIIRENETLDEAIKRFSKKVVKDGIIQECRQREYFLKPSDIRKEKQRRLKKQHNYN